MIRLLLRSLRARPLRTVLTATTVVVGVAMIAAALTLGDSLRGAADHLGTDAYGGTAAVVAQPTAFRADDSFAVRPVPDATLSTVRAVPGVAVAAGDVSDDARIIGGDGLPVGDGPYFGVGLDAATPGAARLTPFRLRSGTWASGPGQVVVDAATAKAEHLAIGDDVRISTRGPAQRFTVVGTAGFGDIASLGAATAAIFDLRTARSLFGRTGVDSILVGATPGTDAATVRARLRHALPQLQVSTAAAQDRFGLHTLRRASGIVKWVLFAFGIVAVLIGAFTIVNTMSVTVAARTRELALLRALGASRRQVLGSVVAEALVMGVLASALGLLAGIGLAPALSGLLAAAGIGLPADGTVVHLSTVLVSLGVGTVVTVLAGLRPARAATRVSPVLALRDGPVTRHGGRATAALRATIGLVGRPAQRLGGVAGGLGRANAMRRPGRTLSTAAAVSVGVALVTMLLVLAHGLRQSTTGLIAHRVTADYVLAGADDQPDADPGALAALATVPGVRAVSAVRQDTARAFGADAVVDGVDPATIAGHLRYTFDEGSTSDLTGLAGDDAIVRSDFAADHGLRVGSSFAVTTRSHGRRTFRVRAIEHDDPGSLFFGMGVVTIARSTFDAAFDPGRDALALLSVDGGATPAMQRALQARLAAFPGTRALTGPAFADLMTQWVDKILAIFEVLLALAVLISLLGVVNMLTLSVLERTRELAMLRSVGMTRRQLRRTVRHESLITALLGAGLGLVAGLALAEVAARLWGDAGLAFAVPVAPVAATVALAALAGVGAAVLPARRAARLDPVTVMASA